MESASHIYVKSASKGIGQGEFWITPHYEVLSETRKDYEKKSLKLLHFWTKNGRKRERQL